MSFGDTFQKVFTRRTNKAAVRTDKAKEKLLEDDQYVPPPGHVAIIKSLKSDENGNGAYFCIIGGARMD